MKIAIVHNDVDIIRLFDFLLTEKGHQILWTTNDASNVLNKCRDNLPDLILIQLLLPQASIPDLIKDIMSEKPTTIIVVGDAIKQHTTQVFEAMSAGALDAFAEPSSEHPESFIILNRKIKNINNLHKSLSSNSRFEKIKVQPEKSKTIPLVAIGSSTGGPAALVNVLSKINPDTPAAFVVIQHMDVQFSYGMVKWIDEKTDIKVQMAVANQRPEAGIVYVAGTDDHLVLQNNSTFCYTDKPVDYPYRPSVDVFFESLITHWPGQIVGVLLTGMGRDGSNGLLSLHNRKMHTIAQDKESSAVYGMPKAAAELNAATEILPIDKIGQAINNILLTIN